MKKRSDWLRVKTVAARLNVGKSTAYRLIEDGCFVAARFGGAIRIYKPSLDEYISDQVVKLGIEYGFVGKME